MGLEVFGREQEGATVAAFVAAAPSGPSVLEIIGEAGIGKTTLWMAALEHASVSGMAIASARAAEAESLFAFSALTDLLEPYIPLLDDLPQPQRRALSVALLRAEPAEAPVDHRAVATGALGVVRAIAAERPLLIGIDDVQWTDLPTLRVVEFVVRRLRSEPVRLVAARRGEAVEAPAPTRLPLATSDPAALRLGPLGAEALHQLLLSRLGVPLTRPALLHLHRATGGNPFYSLQIVQHALQQDPAALASFEQFTVPPSLHSLLSTRLTGVGPEARQLLLVLSALSRPTMRLLDRVHPDGSAAELLASLEREGIISVGENGIRFAHPLLASTVYADAPAEERRKVHRLLASHAETPEERARHLALGALEPDEEIAGVLESAAAHARARGAPDAAAELLDLACRLTPVQQASSAARLPRRRIAHAESLLDAGDTRGAGTLIRELLPELQPGHERADAYELHAFILAADERWADAKGAFADAVGDVGDDEARRGRLEAGLTYASLFTGSLHEARRHGRAALALAEAVAQPELLAETLQALGFIEFQLHGGIPWHLMRRAVAEEERGSWASASMLRSASIAAGPPPRSYSHNAQVRPRFALGQMLMAVDELDRAREMFVALLRAADEVGDANAPATFLAYLSQIECLAGNWHEASRYAREARSWALQTGMRTVVISAQLLIDAHSGDLGAARRGADEAMELVRATGALWTAIPILGARGLAELSAGDLDAAGRALDEATSLVSAQGIAEPGYGRTEPLAIEVDIRRGRLDEAERRVDAFESAGRRLERPWVLASASRARALLAAARGDLELAHEAGLHALVGMENLGRPFEVARTHLALGVIERRRRKKRLAREHLELATAGFDKLGARLWAEQAGEELSRTGYRSPERGLSPTERRVAELVAEGLSNREIANALFVTVNTVESTLRHAFLKLGIHSRAELARHLDR
jgi:DNA-binding CsgD family transcriptional regulator